MREPVEAVSPIYHHLAQLLETIERYVECIVNEDDVLDAPDRAQVVQLLFDAAHAGQSQLASTRRIIAEGTVERAAPRSSQLNGGPHTLSRKSAPIDPIVIERVILTLDMCH